MVEYIDLTIPLEESNSEPESVYVEKISHAEGAAILTKGRGFGSEAFPQGIAVNLERVRLTSHSGTHIDAPLHYGPSARSIDQLPLDWFFGSALVIDCSEKKLEEPISIQELEKALLDQNLKVEKGDIVFIFTGADSLWGTKEYFTSFRGMSLSACNWLLDKQVNLIGVDTFGFDPPFAQMLDAYEKTGDSTVLWPCHVLGRKREYCQIERLANLGRLPKNRKFFASCFPINLKGCGAAPARVVAIIENK